MVLNLSFRLGLFSLFVNMVLVFCFIAPVGAVTAQEALEKILSDPFRHVKNHNFNPDSSLDSRFGPPPPKVLDYIKEYDKNPNYTPHSLSAKDRRVIKNTLKKLPPILKKTLQESAVGIYFIDNFQGGGLTEWLVDDQKRVFTFVLLNSDVLSTSLSSWLTQKDQSVFKNDSSQSTLTINMGKEDSGLLYILLHEGAHVLDYAHPQTPYPDFGISALRPPNFPNSFTQGIWLSYFRPTNRFISPLPYPINFYGFGGGPSIPQKDAKHYYNWLARTPFPSLYASKSWAEDYAEVFTLLYLTQTLKKPYQITLHSQGQKKLIWEPIKNPLVEKRFSCFKRIFSKN